MHRTLLAAYYSLTDRLQLGRQQQCKKQSQAEGEGSTGPRLGHVMSVPCNFQCHIVCVQAIAITLSGFTVCQPFAEISIAS
jgi:hypothetical protein